MFTIDMASGRPQLQESLTIFCPPGDLQELARKEMLELIERLLLEADLDSELSKLDVYGKTIDGLKDFLKHLLLDPNTGQQEPATHQQI